MTDRATHINTHLTVQQTTLTTLLATQILKLETQIADLNTHKQCLEQARTYILSSSTTSSTPRPNPYRTSRSNLRQQAIVRSAMGRDNALSLPGAAGLLAEEDFEAAFGSGGEVVASVEEVGGFVMSGAGRAGEAASSNLSNTTSPPATGKRAKKRRQQENAAKAREGRMRKLEGKK
jgi:hypothetical protein